MRRLYRRRDCGSARGYRPAVFVEEETRLREYCADNPVWTHLRSKPSPVLPRTIASGTKESAAIRCRAAAVPPHLPINGD